MQYRTSNYVEDVFDTFYFEKNLHGDIIAVYNKSGTKLVSYIYDAWGNCTTTYYNSGSSTGAQYNPFRYRGYHYDSDLGLYYLNSRYYDPNTGRFINADGQLNNTILGYNQYTYCENNPIMYVDYTGSEPISIATVTGLVMLFTVLVCSAIKLVTSMPSNPSSGFESFPMGIPQSLGDNILPFPITTEPYEPIFTPSNPPVGNTSVIDPPAENIGKLGIIDTPAIEPHINPIVFSKADIKSAGLPTSGKIRFVPGKNGVIGNNQTGYRDKFGNVWTKGPSRTLGESFEWDVQLSSRGRAQLGWASRDGSHINVSQKGRLTHK